MKQALKYRPAPRMGALLILAVALALAACDSDVNVTGPQLPEFPPLDSATDSIWVAASLSSVNGYCYDARMLYDGQKIAQAYCRAGGDCAEMVLAGFAPPGSGRHTVELQVLLQEPPGAEVVYRAAVEVRDDPLASPQLSLATSKALRAGESVIFEFDMP